MGLCAAMAWQASRREPNVGHAYVAAAFATYPVVMVGAALLLGWHARSNLSYLIALPAVIVGITILVVSLLRASLRTEVELRRREAAEANLAQMNTSLEKRVAERTTELQMMIEGLESFAHTVSHDLRGSLGGAAGLSRMADQALAEGDVTRARRMLQVIAPQLEHLTSLVRDLLTLSRLGDAALNRQEQPLEPLVRQALEQLAMEPDCADALRQAVVEVGALPRMAVDSTLLRQVFVNLLANALRFAAAGGHAPTYASAAPRCMPAKRRRFSWKTTAPVSRPRLPSNCSSLSAGCTRGRCRNTALACQSSAASSSATAAGCGPKVGPAKVRCSGSRCHPSRRCARRAATPGNQAPAFAINGCRGPRSATLRGNASVTSSPATLSPAISDSVITNVDGAG